MKRVCVGRVGSDGLVPTNTAAELLIAVQGSNPPLPFLMSLTQALLLSHSMSWSGPP